MKKFAMRMTMVLMAIGMVLGAAQKGAAQNLLRGFSGMTWGTSIDKLPNMQESARSGDIRYFVRPGDIYSIADVTLPEVVYGFYKGQYFAAYMRIATPGDFDKIKSHLARRYGDPRAQLRVNQTIYIWDYLDTKIKLKQYHNLPEAKLAFYYVPLSNRANQARGSDKNVKVYHLDESAPDYDF